MNLLVLVKTSFANLLRRDGKLLETLGKWVGFGAALRSGCGDGLRASETGARDGVGEGLWLWFGGGRCSKSCLCFGCAACFAEEADLGTFLLAAVSYRGVVYTELPTFSLMLLPKSWKLSFTLGG